MQPAAIGPLLERRVESMLRERRMVARSARLRAWRQSMGLRSWTRLQFSCTQIQTQLGQRSRRWGLVSRHFNDTAYGMPKPEVIARASVSE